MRNLAPARFTLPDPLRIEAVVHEPEGPPWLASVRAKEQTRPKSAAHINGLRYEAKQSSWLRYEGFLTNQWYSYLVRGSPTRLWAQVDAFRIDRTRLVVVECKLRWCTEAIDQLCKVYRPLLSWYYKGRPDTSCYVVCRTFDPAVPGSDHAKRVESFESSPGPDTIGVVIRK
jgi:hypothetical protein